MGLGSKRLLKLSVFCVIIIIAWLGVKTLFHPDFGGLLSDTGHETEPKENWNAIFLPQVGGIMENKSGMFIIIIIMHVVYAKGSENQA